MGVWLALANGATAIAACHQPTEQFGPAVVDGMRVNPKILLTNYPQGGFGMQSAVAELTTHGGELIDAIRSISLDANRNQQKFMGLGMADAVKLCITQDPAIAQAIRDAVKASGSSSLRQSFQISIADIDTTPGPPPSLDSSPSSVPAAVNMTLGTSSSKAPIGLADPFGPIESWH